MIWAEAIHLHLEQERSKGLAWSTCHHIRYHLEGFAGFCQELGVDLPAEVTASHLAAYRQHLVWTPTRWRKKLPSPSTVAGVLGHVRSFLRQLVANGQLLVDPARDLVLPKPPRPLPRLLTVEEVARILDHPNPRSATGLRDRALLETLYGTGMRRGECHRLDLVDLDRGQSLLRVQWAKNRQARFAPIGPTLRRALEAYLKRSRPRLVQRHPEESALFVSNQGRRISTARIEQIVELAARLVGIAGHVGPHALRHAYATHLLANGADVREVQALLGHLHLSSTQVYTHLQPQEVIAEHRRTHPRARKAPDR